MKGHEIQKGPKIFIFGFHEKQLLARSKFDHNCKAETKTSVLFVPKQLHGSHILFESRSQKEIKRPIFFKLQIILIQQDFHLISKVPLY